MTQIESIRWISPFDEHLERVAARTPLLSSERANFLSGAAEQIGQSLSERTEIGLNFICTHNSRRSHLGQAWAAIASHRFGLAERVSAYSGGTEATACNERIVRSLREIGLSIVSAAPEESNPLYWLQFAELTAPIRLFSKRHDSSENPQNDFWAMMCCSDADEKCPIISGAIGRVSLHYRDPKESDDSPQEKATYAERRDEIGAEILYLFENIARVVGI